MTDTSDFGTFGRFTETPVEDGIVRPAQVLRIEFSDSGAPFGHLASARPLAGEYPKDIAKRKCGHGRYR